MTKPPVSKLFAIALMGTLPLLARADAPVLWGVTGVGGGASTLYAINPLNGKVLEVGPTGLDNVSGIEVHPTTRVLYGTQGQQGGTKSLLTLSKTRGTASPIGDTGEAVADSAFSPNGVFYIYGASSRDLFTVNLSNASKTLIKADAAPIGSCGITFDSTGDLFMTRINSIANLNPATGNVDSSAVLAGATTDVDNFLARRADGVLFTGRRNNKAAPTQLFTVNPATGATTLAGSVPLALTGMTFDVAPTPVFKVTGPKTKRTTKTSYTLKGTYTSTVPSTIGARSISTTANNGPWKLKLEKLKPGTNRVKLVCEDAAGQKKTQTIRIIVEE
jgi:hypothetical protein